MKTNFRTIVAGSAMGLILVGGVLACGTTQEPVTTTTTAVETVTLTDDDRFIGLLDQSGVYYSSEKAAIEMASVICEQAADIGPDAAFEILWYASLEADYGYTKADVEALFESATVIYCPWVG